MMDSLQLLNENWYVFLLAYLAGSIPFGLMLTKIAGLGDIRAIGSGNIGATNVLRTGNKKLALATLLLDGIKGAIVVIIVKPYLPLNIVAIVGLISVVGHMFPVWLAFKGGKGVATTLAVLLAIYWPIGLIACGIWLVTFFLTRYSSLSALCAVTSAAIASYFLNEISVFYSIAVMALLVVIRHHANIKRLLSGTESKSSFKKKTS